MTTTPEAIEEAVSSLQKVLDHPQTLAALKRTPSIRAILMPITRRPSQSILDFNFVINRLHMGEHSVCVSFVAHIEDSFLNLIMFAESEPEDAIPQFGKWDRETSTLRPMPTDKISDDLETLQKIYATVVDKVLGLDKEYDVPVYI